MDRRHPLLGILTAVLQLAAGLPYFVSGLIAPPGGVIALQALWLALSLWALVVFRRNPRLAPVVPALTVLTGITCLVLGGTFLGWGG